MLRVTIRLADPHHVCEPCHAALNGVVSLSIEPSALSLERESNPRHRSAHGPIRHLSVSF